MKAKILLTICMVLTAISLVNGNTVTPADVNEHIALAIVFDTSTTSSSTWVQLHVLARQSFSSLKAGDRVILISATTGKPVVKANLLIELPTSQNQQQLNAKLASISQGFLARADLSTALAAAFDQLKSQPQAYKCCLILTDGKHDSRQIQQIRRLAGAFKKIGWLLCITAAADANRYLFLAGSQDELQVATLDNANLPQWIESVRPHAAIKPLEVKPPVTEPPKAELATTRTVLDLTPPKPKQSQVPDANSQIKTVPATSLAVTKTPDGNTLPSTATKPSTLVGIHPKTSGKTEVATPSKSIFRKFTIYKLLTILITVALIAFVLFATSLRRRNAEKSVNNDSPSDDNAIHHLMAARDGQEYDLGEENSIERLVLGSNLASAIPLVGEEIKDKEFEIWREDNGYEIHNFGTEELTVNGIPVKAVGRLELLLPSTIQTATGLRISLFRKPVGKDSVFVTDIGGQNNGDKQ